VFVRPHEVDILLTDDDKESTKTTIKRITHLGAEVQIELSLENNLPIIAHLSRQQFTSLNLKKIRLYLLSPIASKLLLKNHLKILLNYLD